MPYFMLSQEQLTFIDSFSWLQKGLLCTSCLCARLKFALLAMLNGAIHQDRMTHYSCTCNRKWNLVYKRHPVLFSSYFCIDKTLESFSDFSKVVEHLGNNELPAWYASYSFWDFFWSVRGTYFVLRTMSNLMAVNTQNFAGRRGIIRWTWMKTKEETSEVVLAHPSSGKCDAKIPIYPIILLFSPGIIVADSFNSFFIFARKKQLFFVSKWNFSNFLKFHAWRDFSKPSRHFSSARIIDFPFESFHSPPGEKRLQLNRNNFPLFYRISIWIRWRSPLSKSEQFHSLRLC